MGYESEMYQEIVHDIRPRLAAIEKVLGINQPVIEEVKAEETEDLTKETEKETPKEKGLTGATGPGPDPAGATGESGTETPTA